MTQVPLYLTPNQAAQRLTDSGMDIAGDTIRRWCRKGLISATRLPGGEYRIHVSTIDALLAAPAAAA